MENQKHKIIPKLEDISETMLITLRAKYLETKSIDGIINDPKSVEIMDQIYYDYSGNKQSAYRD